MLSLFSIKVILWFDFYFVWRWSLKNSIYNNFHLLLNLVSQIYHDANHLPMKQR